MTPVALVTETPYADAMFTAYARTQVALRADIIAQLIWAVKSVRLNLRKPRGE